MEGPSKKSPRPAEPTDSEICEVFFEAIDTLLGDGGDMYSSLRGYLDLFRPLSNPWCEFYPSSESASDQDDYAALKGCLFYRIAYVYRNSTILSSTTAFHFWNILEENGGFLEDLLLQPQIRICSIGGGATSDIVGMVLVLEKLAKARGLSELDIRVTVVDVDPAWESTCLSVLGCLESFRGVKGVRARFVKADLSVPLYPQEAVRAIERAHVVSVVKFLSELSSMACSAYGTVRILNELLHPGSLLFVLDYPVVLNQCGGPQGTIPDSGLLYEEPCQLHVLDLAAVEKNFHHFHQRLEGHVFNTCLKVFARGFLKAVSGRPGRFNTTTRRTKCGEWLLQRSSYEPYEAGFVQRMHHSVGWRLRGILSYLNGQWNVLNDLILVLRDVEEVCREARVTLAAWEEVTGEVDEVAWKKYVDSKRDSAQLRKKIYSELVVMARGYWKSFYDGTYSGMEMMKDVELEW